MEKRRITLDNPEFAGKLRSYERSRAYVRPPATRRPLNYKQKNANKPISDVIQSKPQVDLAKKPILQKPVAANKTIAKKIITQQKPAFQGASLEKAPLKKVIDNNKEGKTKAKKHNRKNIILYAMASILFIFGAAVSINGLMTNHKAEAVVTKIQHSKNSPKNNVPSAKKPSSSSVTNYTVAPNMPRYIDIPSLKVHAIVLPMAVDQNNQLETPDNIYNAGWYNGSSLPGQSGAMLVEAHSGVGNISGIFHDINKLSNGSIIKITRGDSKIFSYTVVKQKTYNANDVDMASMMVSQDSSKPGLNLISCAGDATPGTTEFSHRIIVYAVLQ